MAPLNAPVFDAVNIVQDVPVGPETNTGELTVVTLLMPTCPLVFNPHPYNLPNVVVARLCVAPPAIAVHDVPAGPDTNTGDDLFTTVLSPTCPLLFNPQPHKTPVLVMPKLWLAPADTVVQDDDPIFTGEDLETVLLSPN